MYGLRKASGVHSEKSKVRGSRIGDRYDIKSDFTGNS